MLTPSVRGTGVADEVQIPPIRSDVTYAVALHEIGHNLGRHQNSRRSIVREVWAWRWARTNALIWTPRMWSGVATSRWRGRERNKH